MVSDDQAEAPPDMGAGHSTATDPRGLIGAGDTPDSHFSTGAPPARTLADQTPEERAYNRSLYGLTYNERHGGARTGCVSYCLQPGQRRRGARCPACYGTVDIRPLTEDSDIEPGPTRMDRFAAWAGSWVGAFLEAVMFPFRVGRAHTEAMVRDILREALAAGLQVDTLGDILTALEGIEQTLGAIRNQADRIGENRLCPGGSRSR